MVVQMEQMASRPFSTVPIEIENMQISTNRQKENTEQRPLQRRKKVKTDGI